jgi:dTDP-4-amino-4,6-dideoxygalactose transaminase
MDLGAQNQSLKQETRLALDAVILNHRFIGGIEVRQFETAYAAFCGPAYAIGVSSGTSALELALRAVGIGPGDEVITTPHTFIATAEAIVTVGARPVFVDVEQATGNIDPRLIPAAVTARTKAILPVHLYGRMAGMEAICAIARAHGLRVIEDAAQAHGASLHGKGPGKWGDAACFSFFPAKNLGAFGDAGGVVTDDADVARRVAAYRDHGRSEKYVSGSLGTGARLDTLQAAVLGVKLPHLARWNEARRRLAAGYLRDLADLPLSVVQPQEGCVDAYYVFIVRTPEREALKQFLNQAGISTGIYYPVPLHLQPACASLGHSEGSFPVAERWARECLALPLYPELPEAWRAHVATKVRAFFATR